MKKKIVSLLLSFLFFACAIHAQVEDTTLLASDNIDTVLQETIVLPSAETIESYQQLSNHKSFLQRKNMPVLFDVQQFRSSDKNATAFLLLMVLLLILTYVRVAFSNDLEELFQSFINKNISQQIFRTQSKDFSFSSFLLYVIFFVAIGLYVQFILLNYFHVSSLKNFSATLAIIFLFTFFYIAKVSALWFIGLIFEVKEECNEYIYNFSIICKIAGLTLIPALFIFQIASEKIYNPVFAFTVLVLAVFVLVFVWRGLSTGLKLMYRSVYHFFIYVCVVEISPIFLLFKLLTKTVN